MILKQDFKCFKFAAAYQRSRRGSELLHSLRVCGPLLPAQPPPQLGHPAPTGSSASTRWTSHSKYLSTEVGQSKLICDRVKSQTLGTCLPPLHPHHRCSSLLPWELPSTKVICHPERVWRHTLDIHGDA